MSRRNRNRMPETQNSWKIDERVQSIFVHIWIVIVHRDTFGQQVWLPCRVISIQPGSFHLYKTFFIPTTLHIRDLLVCCYSPCINRTIKMTWQHDRSRTFPTVQKEAPPKTYTKHWQHHWATSQPVADRSQVFLPKEIISNSTQTITRYPLKNWDERYFFAKKSKLRREKLTTYKKLYPYGPPAGNKIEWGLGHFRCSFQISASGKALIRA